MSYSKPWIHKAASRSLQLLRSPIHLFLIEISSVFSHTQSHLPFQKEIQILLSHGLTHYMSDTLGLCPQRVQRGKSISHFTFIAIIPHTFSCCKLPSRKRRTHPESEQTAHLSLTLGSRYKLISQHDLTPISWSAHCELLTWSMFLPKSENPALWYPLLD